MKHSVLYKITIAYTLLFILAILLSGLSLFWEHHGGGSISAVVEQFFIRAEEKSLEGILELLTPHTVSMALSLFVISHFLLFSERFSQKKAIYIVIGAFILAGVNNFSYLVMSFGLLTFGWVKLLAMGLFVVLFLLLLGMVALSL